MLGSNLLKIGCLLVGSLAWDEGLDGALKTWREEKLAMDRVSGVRVPIRYGRRSSPERDGTYKMVFSKKAPPGRALVVPFRDEVQNLEELLARALEIWRLDVGDEASGLASPRGRMALLPRDETSQTCPRDILDGWADLARAQPQEFAVSPAHDESAAIDNSGFLQIDWPDKLDGQPLTEVDALLAVVAQPTLTLQHDYADSEEIAKAWLRNPDQDFYFYKNREHGIVTFEDDAILEEFWKASTGSCGGIVIC